MASLRLREATQLDNEALCNLLVGVSIASGTAFSLDRNPDFFALLRCRGEHRTWVVETRDERIVGAVSVLWHSAYAGPGCSGEACRVGEIVDLRVVPTRRYSRATFLLLQAACAALAAVNVTWLTCLIGAKNQTAASLTQSGRHFPTLQPLTTYRSVHYPTWRGFGKPHASVQEHPNDAAFAREVSAAAWAATALVPLSLHSATQHDRAPKTHCWVTEQGGRNVAGLVVSDLAAVRRIRVDRYTPSDWPLLGMTSVLAAVGRATPLPKAGDALKIWATRCVWAENAQQLARLLRAAIFAAGEQGAHVLQVNVADSSPLAAWMPKGPRSTFYSTLFGAPVVTYPDARRLGSAVGASTASGLWFADVAMA